MFAPSAFSTAQATSHWGPWDHMGWAGSWFMWIFWVALLVLIILAIRWLSTSSRGGGGAPSEDAETTLRRRYAAGEIDEETFRRMRDELRR